MEIIGISRCKNSRGQVTTTLHLADQFPAYFEDPSTGRSCFGRQVQTVFLNTYDASELEVGMEIDVYYDKAVTTAKGTFQTIKKIDII